MVKRFAALALLTWLTALPGRADGGEFDSIACAHKRVDACGCHHVYGVRHCHPNRKSDRCVRHVNAEPSLDELKQEPSEKKSPIFL